MNSSDISVLVVGFNSLHYLKDAIGSITIASARHSSEVYFVNNGTDGSENLMYENYPHVKVLPSKGNIGFGAANNYLAQASRSRWLLLLNPDTRLSQNAIDLLIEAAQEHPDFGIFGGLSTDKDGVAIGASVLEFPALLTIIGQAFGFRRAPKPSADCDVLEVDAVSGGFMLISRNVWDALGGFDEGFFLYAEELDLCRRWHNLGGKVGFVRTARLMHDVGSGVPDSPLRQLMLMRGTATYYRKHFPTRSARICLVALWLGCLVRFLVGSLASPVSRRLASRARALGQVSLQPWSWMGGYKRGAFTSFANEQRPNITE